MYASFLCSDGASIHDKVTIEEICIENRQQDGISTKQIYQNKNIDINRITDVMKDF